MAVPFSYLESMLAQAYGKERDCLLHLHHPKKTKQSLKLHVNVFLAFYLASLSRKTYINLLHKLIYYYTRGVILNALIVNYQ